MLYLWLMMFLLLVMFLEGRTQQVLVEGVKSTTTPVHSGVPQGSVLGPLLFLLYINDIPDAVSEGTTRLFADDCALHREVVPLQALVYA
jgi:hypothetical protein